MWKEKKEGLYKKFEFKSFAIATKFINDVFAIANQLNHHPTINNTYSTVELYLKTHETDSISEKDYKFAELVDEITSKKTSSKLDTANVFTDGGSRGNPGPSAIGVVILDKDKNRLAEISEYIGETTNNQAEYRALEAGIKKASELGISKLSVFMDSELIINQINGKYKVKKAELIPLFQSIKDLSINFDQISFEHVRRENNKIADGLVNKALDARLS